jgi:hypothetical protein
MDLGQSEFSVYSNNSKNVCLYTTVSIVLILLFIVTPLSKYILASLFGKIIALLILAYALYQNYTNTITLSNATSSTLFKGQWSNIKSNLLCSYIFTFFILLLIFSVLKNMIF